MTPFFLPHGISVGLCRRHRESAFLERRSGASFTQRLEAMWRAHGIATRRRLASLATYRRRLSQRDLTRELPGSYAWPRLRAEAERRFASGERPHDVIGELRGRYPTAHANVPSVRTMRRWHNQRRWCENDARPTGERPPTLGWQRGLLDWPEEYLFGILTPFLFEDPPTPYGRSRRRRSGLPPP